MGLSNSKLCSHDDPVKICKDRKRFIKQAVEHRTNFASSHIAYILSLRNVSNALREFIQGNVEPHEFKTSNLMPCETRPVQVQETLSSPDESMACETRPVQVQESTLSHEETNYKVESYEADSFLEMNMHMNTPPSSQRSEWDDFFWSPFSAFDYNGYNYDNQISGMDDDEMRRIREEEGIPDLEEDDHHHHHNMKASEDCNGGEMNQEDKVEHVNEENEVVTTDREETDVYLNRRPTSMGEVIKDLEDQFTTIFTSANEVSGLLEANKVQCTTSSRLLISSESSSVISEESCVVSGHQASLDRLYLWEKKLYDEVKSGERVRIAYEKKSLALRNHDVKGDESSSIDKTRVRVRDLNTQMKVYIRSIESISARIETLRDQELLPQILELLQGLVKMWKVMAECHQIQKRTMEESKLLLSSSTMLCNHHQERSALNLVDQLLNWRACFQAWIRSQRSYVLSLTGWLLTCIRCDPDPEKVTLSTYPYVIFEVCIGWSRLLNRLNEKHVLDKLDFFVSCMGSIFEPKEEPYSGTTEGMELVEAEEVENAKKMAEIAIKVVCNGMSVAVSSLAEFATTSADEHSKLVNHLDDGTSEQHQEQTGM